MQEFSKRTGVSVFLMIVLIILALAVAGCGVWYYMDKQMSDQKAELNSQIADLRDQVDKLGASVSSSTATTSSTADVTANWKTYTNEEIGFSFKYPSDWKEPELVKHTVRSDVGSGTDFGNFNNDGMIKADPDGLFSFLVESKGYSNLYGNNLFGKAIDTSWSQSQFETTIMQNNSGTLEFYKKLDAKSILIGYYQNIECSQSLVVQVVTPIKDSYPNLVISINGNYGSDPIISAAESSATAANADVCDLESAYKQVANKVLDGTFSTEVADGIETAQLIANSVIALN